MKSEECAGSVSGTTVAARAKRRPRAARASSRGRARGGVAVAADVIGPQRVERHDEQVARAAAEPRGGHGRASQPEHDSDRQGQDECGGEEGSAHQPRFWSGGTPAGNSGGRLQGGAPGDACPRGGLETAWGSESRGPEAPTDRVRSPGNARSTGAFPGGRQNLSFAPSMRRRGVTGLQRVEVGRGLHQRGHDPLRGVAVEEVEGVRHHAPGGPSRPAGSPSAGGSPGS